MPNKLNCIICTETFASSDEVYSTTCGHIYHLACIQQWRARDTTCPQCRRPGTDGHKIYLNLEPDTETEDEIRQLTVNIDSLKSRNDVLETNMSKTETEFLQLQAQYNEHENNNRQLDIKLESILLHSENLQSKLKLVESEFLQLQAQYSENENKNRQLGINLESIQSHNDNLQVKLNLVESEFLQLQAQYNVKDNEMKDLIEKNKYLTMQSEQYKTKLKNNTAVLKDLNERVAKLSVSPNVRNIATNKLSNQSPSQCHKPNSGNCSVPNSNIRSILTNGENSNNSMKVKSDKTIYNNQKFVPPSVSTGAQAVLPQKGMIPTNSDPFHSNGDNYSSNSYLNNKTSFPLYEKAKILRLHGYNFVYVHNGAVFARISKDTDPIHITSFQQVNQLLAETLLA